MNTTWEKMLRGKVLITLQTLFKIPKRRNKNGDTILGFAAGLIAIRKNRTRGAEA
ncbi:hypothetical protein [Acidithiobacillus caldus]|uniref:hypothetical protein n=1 Tax=Acidithiobacillus caldus TaxID=33059 RepID=UPI001C07A512|nr:hypothetical protein [Acidithiobacillus caldus]MBU2771177.1 hypothetical protein [Acidithiobacillus caldus]